MSGLDPRSLLVAFFVVEFLATTCLLFVWAFGKTYDGFGYWVGSFGAMAAAGLLLGARGVIPDFLSVIVANALAFLAATLQLHAGRIFLGRKGVGAMAWSAFAVVMIAFVFLTHVRPSLSARIVVAEGYSVAFFVALAWELIRHPPAAVAQASRFTGVFVAAYAAVSTARGVSGFIGSDGAEYLDPAYFLVSTSLLGLLFATGIPYGVLLMNQQRLEADLAGSESELAEVSEEVKTLRGLLPISASCK